MHLFDDGDNSLELSVNPQFAKEYEGRKKHEELSNLQEKFKGMDPGRAADYAKLKRKYGNDVAADDMMDDTEFISGSSDESSSDDEEDEVGELITPDVDAQILKTIALIRKRDPAVYEQSANFFSEDALIEAQQNWKKKQHEVKIQNKKTTLKDLERAQVLQGVVDVDAAGDEELEKVKELSHVEQLKAFKNEFKTAAFGDEDADDTLFTTVEKTRDDVAREEEEYKRFLFESMAEVGGEEYLTAWNDHKGAINDKGKMADPNEQFLMDFILNRGWIEKDDKQGAARLWGDDAHPVDEIKDLDADEEVLDQIDGFERNYNFRYEEAPALDEEFGVKTYARTTGDSARRKDDKRIKQREARKLRKEAELKQKQEELKRLKNLKREELMSKIRQIAEVAGDDSVDFNEVDLEAEFDPDAWDTKMNQVFDEKFYSSKDDGKPEWNDDIEVDDLIAPEDKKLRNPGLALPATDSIVPSIGQEGTKKKKRRRKRQDDDRDDFIDVPDADEMDVSTKVMPSSSTNTKSHAPSVDHPDMSKYLDEMYKLDYEDIVGGNPVRFRYRQVPATSFGLSLDDILEADDADLNQYVSMKKFAPFRPPEKIEKDLRKYSQKHRVNAFRQMLMEKKRQSSTNEQGGGAEETTQDPFASRLAAYQPETKRSRRMK